MYVKSRHINGWSTFAVAHTSLVFDIKSPTVVSPPSKGSGWRNKFKKWELDKK